MQFGLALQESEIESILKNEIYSSVGFNIEDEAAYPLQYKVNKFDILSGLMSYYASRPITNGWYVDNLLHTQKSINLQYAKPSKSDEWHFIGIMGEGRLFNYSSNMLDTRLLGIARSFFYVDPLQKDYTSTSIDNNIGKPEYFYDQVEQKIYIITGGDALNLL